MVLETGQISPLIGSVLLKTQILRKSDFILSCLNKLSHVGSLKPDLYSEL